MRAHGAIAHLRHRRASGRPEGSWEFDPARRVLILSVPCGAKIVAVDVPVCSQARPVANRWVIVERGESEWTLTPVLWPVDPFAVARGRAFHEDLPLGSVELTSAPPEIARELRRL